MFTVVLNALVCNQLLCLSELSEIFTSAVLNLLIETWSLKSVCVCVHVCACLVVCLSVCLPVCVHALVCMCISASVPIPVMRVIWNFLDCTFSYSMCVFLQTQAWREGWGGGDHRGCDCPQINSWEDRGAEETPQGHSGEVQVLVPSAYRSWRVQQIIITDNHYPTDHATDHS